MKFKSAAAKRAYDNLIKGIVDGLPEVGDYCVYVGKNKKLKGVFLFDDEEGEDKAILLASFGTMKFHTVSINDIKPLPEELIRRFLIAQGDFKTNGKRK